MTKLYGFTFMRGVEKLDYPYLEMLQSLAGLTEKIYIALAPSDDKTEEKIHKLKETSPIEIIPTTWDDKFMSDGGKIFSGQANIALEKLREEVQDNDAWAVFLHCDEIVHPNQYQLLRDTIEQAKAEGADAIRFRFLHFWKNNYQIAVTSSWHPSEVRAFKIKSDVICWGDAQGFAGAKKEILSDVNVLHYGHVRDTQSYEKQQAELIRRIRPAEKFHYYRIKNKFKSSLHKSRKIMLAHPTFLKDRIERLGDKFEHEEKDRVYILDKKDNYDQSWLKTIAVKEILWISDISEVPFLKRFTQLIIPYPSTSQSLLYGLKKSVQMESPHAEKWSRQMNLLFRLSEKEIGLKS